MLLKMLHVANYGFDEGKLKAEYISFIEIYPKLRKPKDDRPFNETSPGPSDDINRENFIAVLKVLSTLVPLSVNLNLLRTTSDQQWDRSD